MMIHTGYDLIMRTLFGITLVLYLLKLSAGKDSMIGDCLKSDNFHM